MTPKPMMDAFEEELAKAKVDWQVMMFGGRMHRSAIRPSTPGRRAPTRSFSAQSYS